jgi:sugar-specific transcriptional regulator TrmB
LVFQDQDIQTLITLGLTILEARVYLALAKAGKATLAATLSKTSKVARPDVYRTLAKLQEKGLVEKIIATPTKFKLIPMRESLITLFENKRNDILQVEEKVNELLWNFKEKDLNTIQENESQLSLFPERVAARREEKTLENVLESFDVVTTLRNPYSVLFIDIEKIAEALQRGVEVRIIIDKYGGKESIPDFLKHLKKSPNFKIRYLPNAPKALMSMYDKKEAWICTCINPEVEACPTLRTSNSCLLSIFQDYFEMMWLKTIESNHQDLPQT